MRNVIILLILTAILVIGNWCWNLVQESKLLTTLQPYPAPFTSVIPQTSPSTTQPHIVVSVPSIPQETPNSTELAEPIAQFKSRITKKFFGTYVTPQNSPVSPEKFSGYHAGVDVEYVDLSADVPVFAIADGEVVSAQTASGYGGVMVEKFSHDGKTLYAIYGHIRLSSAKKLGAVKKGEQIAVLGTGFSAETDGERRHLHFGIATQNTIRGYVASKAALSPTFIDPLSLYP